VRSNLAMSCLMAGQPDRAVEALAGADAAAAPRRARQDLALALAATGRKDEAMRVLRADIAAPEASALIEEFVHFATWLANADGGKRVSLSR
jgi:Flp pilus assembly protein TadD